MKLDRAIDTFLESYDKEAMESIDRFSEHIGYDAIGVTLKGFNITEAFSKFNEYLEGYANYKIENKNNEKASPQELINETTNKFINESVFVEEKYKTRDAKKFVQKYLEGVSTTINNIEKLKSKMISEEVDMESVGIINEYADKFMERMDPLFTEAMDKLLMATGYKKISRLKKEKIEFI